MDIYRITLYAVVESISPLIHMNILFLSKNVHTWCLFAGSTGVLRGYGSTLGGQPKKESRGEGVLKGWEVVGVVEDEEEEEEGAGEEEEKTLVFTHQHME